MDVVPVLPGRDLGRFIRLPFRIYERDPHWVAPLPSDERTRLTPGKNPYFDHAEAAYFLAREGGRDVGRISASVDRNYDSLHGERQATFGFFEAESGEAAGALLARAESWSRDRNAEVLRGPMSFTTNDDLGLLIEGFERRPTLMMPYNPPSYREWIERAGFTKAKDLYAYTIVPPEKPPEHLVRAGAVCRERYGVTVRPLDMRRYHEELDRVKQIYNQAWEQNWGFVPMTDREVEHMAAQLKPAVVPDFVLFAEIEGKPAGFGLVLPDVNILLHRIRGRLFPFGLLRLLWGLPRLREGRLMALGVRKEYRRRGIESLLVGELMRVARRLGWSQVELGWTLEDNHLINRAIDQAGGVRYKTYRIFERRL
ncbi:MAG TPA: GNAT family N-acetyltransferase [Candidatus Eisenbacteria bacterium]